MESYCQYTGCSRTANLSCTRCLVSRYCSKAHQVSHWTDHKRTCTSITTSYQNFFREHFKEEEMKWCKTCPQRVLDCMYQMFQPMFKNIGVNIHQQLKPREKDLVKWLKNGDPKHAISRCLHEFIKSQELTIQNLIHHQQQVKDPKKAEVPKKILAENQAHNNVKTTPTPNTATKNNNNKKPVEVKKKNNNNSKNKKETTNPNNTNEKNNKLNHSPTDTNSSNQHLTEEELAKRKRQESNRHFKELLKDEGGAAKKKNPSKKKSKRKAKSLKKKRKQRKSENPNNEAGSPEKKEEVPQKKEEKKEQVPVEKKVTPEKKNEKKKKPAVSEIKVAETIEDESEIISKMAAELSLKYRETKKEGQKKSPPKPDMRVKDGDMDNHQQYLILQRKKKRKKKKKLKKKKLAIIKLKQKEALEKERKEREEREKKEKEEEERKRKKREKREKAERERLEKEKSESQTKRSRESNVDSESSNSKSSDDTETKRKKVRKSSHSSSSSSSSEKGRKKGTSRQPNPKEEEEEEVLTNEKAKNKEQDIIIAEKVNEINAILGGDEELQKPKEDSPVSKQNNNGKVDSTEAEEADPELLRLAAQEYLISIKNDDSPPRPRGGMIIQEEDEQQEESTNSPQEEEEQAEEPEHEEERKVERKPEREESEQAFVTIALEEKIGMEKEIGFLQNRVVGLQSQVERLVREKELMNLEYLNRMSEMEKALEMVSKFHKISQEIPRMESLIEYVERRDAKEASGEGNLESSK